MRGLEQGYSYTRAFPVSIAVHLLVLALLGVGMRFLPTPVKEVEYIECQMVECEPEKETRVPEKKPENKIVMRKPELQKPLPAKPEPPKPPPAIEQPAPMPVPQPVVQAPQPEPPPVPKAAEAHAPAPVAAAPTPKPATPPAPVALPAPPAAKAAQVVPAVPAKPDIYDQGAAGTVNAVLVHQVKPNYPMFERRNEIEGKVGVKLLVMEDGTVGEVLLIKPSGSKNFDEEAQKAVRAWKFKPAKKGEAPVRMWMKLAVVFRLNE